MSLMWTAGLAIIVLVEKPAPTVAKLAPHSAFLLLGACFYVAFALEESKGPAPIRPGPPV